MKMWRGTRKSERKKNRCLNNCKSFGFPPQQKHFLALCDRQNHNLTLRKRSSRPPTTSFQWSSCRNQLSLECVKLSCW
ncbi:hypothetical protein DPMN_096846 [Dreissena polymorpha]|uniref:Uncharacterized protein n=1 Tax=Dreissena polymorpha TaxID=45954 RepID=A0A9D4R461_DREPO|nr:hypothetical protein DPMN_096846 [Dreissena polymorpha]